MRYKQTIKPDNLDRLFEKLADTYLQLGGKSKVVLTIVGGASVMMGFSFRKMTMDIDAFFSASDLLSKAISIIANEENLPQDWINSDFVNTPSFSERLMDVAKLYKTYSGILEVNFVYGKYLIAMKIKSSRPTSNDLDDIVKMIYQMRLEGKLSSFEDVSSAFEYLYDNNYENVYDFVLEEARNAFSTSMDLVSDIIKPSIFDL